MLHIEFAISSAPRHLEDDHEPVRIQMTKEGGVFKVPCSVNGLKMKFVFDTGAVSVSISMREASFMYDNDYITDDDILSKGSFMMADGSIVENTIINLREIVIGGVTIHNVETTVMNDFGAPLLLGQNVIGQLGPIQIDGDQLILLDPKGGGLTIDERLELYNQAWNAQDNGQYALASDFFLKIYNAEGLTNTGLLDLGTDLYLSDECEQALKYLLLVDLNDDRIDKGSYYKCLVEIYGKLNDDRNRLITIQKMLLLDDIGCEDKAYARMFLAIYYSDKEDYEKSVEFYMEAMNLQAACMGYSCKGEDLIKQIDSRTITGENIDLFYTCYVIDKSQLNPKYDFIYDLKRQAKGGNEYAQNLLNFYKVDY
jgi:clan AA aspartic protease (TIGR02281 family)